MDNSNTSKHKQPTGRIIQNFHLVWLDANINEKDDDFCNSITKLRQVVNTVNTFVDADKCIDFINTIQDETTFMIISGALGQTIVPTIHSKKQISDICIFCGNKVWHEKWAKNWSKIKDVFTDIQLICEALKQAAYACDHNAVSINFATTRDAATSDSNKNTLDCSFMYTQILKDILLTIDFNRGHIVDFLKYCRVELAGNSIELKNVDRIENEYRNHQPI